MLVRRLKLEEFLCEVARSQVSIKVDPKEIKESVPTGKKTPEGKDEFKQVKTINCSYNNPDYVIGEILDYIEYFNTIGEFDVKALDVELNQINVPSELAWLVTERLVRLDPSNYWTKQILIYDVEKQHDKSLAEWNLLCNHFRRFYKRDAVSDMVTLDSLKKSVSIADVLPRVCCNNKVAYQDKAFVPVDVEAKAVKGLFEPEYFNQSASFVLKRYISELKFKKQQINTH